MTSRSSSRGDAAYDRAVAAYEARSYDEARRWVLDALAQDPDHAGARALLGRLDARRSNPHDSGRFGPEVVSTDPTVLISRASRPREAEPIDPTVMVQRDEPRRRLGDTGARAAVPSPKRYAGSPVADPTVISRDKERAPFRSKKPFSLGALLQELGARLQGSGGQTQSARGRAAGFGRLAPGTRGALIAVAVLVAAALLVWSAILASRWLWPAGQLLTITMPSGGTIVGPGLNCGTRGSECSTRRPSGDPVELEARADADHVFSGFTGDCAPTGRTSMTQPRTCGATFDPVAAAAPPVTFRLTVTKPTGGTVVGAGGILCGSLGSSCEADIPNGAPVALHFEADTGYTFSQFTGDCGGSGETTMTSAKTCGATFIQTSVPVANRGPEPVAPGPPRPRPSKQAAAVAPAPAIPPGSKSASPAPSGLAPSQTPTTDSTPTPASPDKPAAPPITAEEHAKNEIQQLAKDYCAEFETLEPGRIQKLFPLVNQALLRNQFRQYKSLKCTITAPLEYDRLDARPAGGAQAKFAMKQVIQMKSGGAPQTIETIVTMVVSRTDLRNPWLIDRVRFEPKPKP